MEGRNSPAGKDYFSTEKGDKVINGFNYILVIKQIK